MHKVAVLALDQFVSFDLSIPCEVFARALDQSGRPAYAVSVCGPKKLAKSEHFEIRLSHGLDMLLRADTIVVPGLSDLDAKIPASVLDALQKAAKRGTRIASVCSGAFILAQTGLLDGMRATTHWLAAEEFRRRFPAVDMDPNVLYVDNGQFLTSAGAASGLDLCLHMVRLDHGVASASHVARVSVMPLERAGGQAQYIQHVPPVSDGASLEPLLHWIEKNSHRDLSLQQMSAKAIVSERTLTRQFKLQVGISPLQWLLKTRIAKSQVLLEETKLSVEAIAEKIGFGTSAAYRDQFRRHVGNSPIGYRSVFKMKP